MIALGRASCWALYSDRWASSSFSYGGRHGGAAGIAMRSVTRRHGRSKPSGTGEVTSMRRVLPTIALTLVIMFVIPFPVYGTLAAFTGMEPPTEGSVAVFMLSVFVIKVGVAVAFVLLFALAYDYWAKRWATYAGIWWGMFAVVELGQAITPDYSWLDAAGGIAAEAIYFPLAALVVAQLLKRPAAGVESA
jgi:hypothetical protein